MKYYRLLDDLEIKKRWFIGELENIDWDFWQYIRAKPLDEIPTKPMPIEMQEKGIPLDFTYAAFELPIVNKITKELFSINDVNFYLVINKLFKEEYYLMHILHQVDCVDEKKSTFDKFEENDPIRPDLAGQYKTIYKLKLKKDIKFNHDIFRVKNYDTAIIISEKIKNKFEELNLIGVEFQEV